MMDQLGLTNGQAAPTGQACGYFIGKPKDGPCKRCGLPWLAHWPELTRPRRARPVRQICDVCSFELDSEQHRQHCGG